MFFQILKIIQMILGFILEMEFNFEDATSAEKKASVMKSASAELVRQGFLSGDDALADASVRDHVGKIVDGAVGVFNGAGVFRHTPSSSSAAPAPPDPEPPPEE